MPAAAPVQSARAELRARILAQARDQLFARGYRAFTMDDLAAELGLSKKTLYVHFRGKDALLRAAIDALAAGIRARADALFAEPELTFAEKLRAFAEEMAARLSRVSPALLRDLQRFAPALHRHIEQVRGENIAAIFGRFLEEGQLAGAVRGDLSPVFAGEFYLCAIQGLLQPDTLRRLGLAPAEVFARAVSLFFGGLLTAAGQKDHEKLFPR